MLHPAHGPGIYVQTQLDYALPVICVSCSEESPKHQGQSTFVMILKTTDSKGRRDECCENWLCLWGRGVVELSLNAGCNLSVG